LTSKANLIVQKTANIEREAKQQEYALSIKYFKMKQ